MWAEVTSKTGNWDKTCDDKLSIDKYNGPDDFFTHEKQFTSLIKQAWYYIWSQLSVKFCLKKIK